MGWLERVWSSPVLTTMTTWNSSTSLLISFAILFSFSPYTDCQPIEIFTIAKPFPIPRLSRSEMILDKAFSTELCQLVVFTTIRFPSLSTPLVRPAIFEATHVPWPLGSGSVSPTSASSVYSHPLITLSIAVSPLALSRLNSPACGSTPVSMRYTITVLVGSFFFRMYQYPGATAGFTGGRGGVEMNCKSWYAPTCWTRSAASFRFWRRPLFCISGNSVEALFSISKLPSAASLRCLNCGEASSWISKLPSGTMVGEGSISRKVWICV